MTARSSNWRTETSITSGRHATTYTYDTSDRLASRTDPVQATARYDYDRNDNLAQMTDRKGQVTGYEYDPLDRLKRITYADSSTIEYVYDAGDRLRQIIDSSAGTIPITRDYDLLDRLTSETTPEGSIGYTYDLDGRRETMTVSGQPIVRYGYDDAHRLTSVRQDTNLVSMTYDDADRPETLTLPNGIVTTSEYDNANQLTSLTYTLGQTTLGTLTYTYDEAGNRTSVGGTWARTGLPQDVTSPTYDAANRIATWAGTAFSYDANGNLASDGFTTYSWNARHQLSVVSGAISASFAYDVYGAGAWAGVGVGAAIAGSGLARAGFRPEMGNWRQAGEWFFPEGTRGPHFHWGSGPGLQTHHLPWQGGNWARNFGALIRRGQAGEDLRNLARVGYGGAVAGSGLAGRACGC